MSPFTLDFANWSSVQVRRFGVCAVNEPLSNIEQTLTGTPQQTDCITRTTKRSTTTRLHFAASRGNSDHSAGRFVTSTQRGEAALKGRNAQWICDCERLLRNLPFHRRTKPHYRLSERT